MHLKCVETYIKTRVLTDCCCAGSVEESVMEDVKRDKRVHKVDGHRYIYETRILTFCCCAGSGEQSVMEDVKRDKCALKMCGNLHKNKSTYRLLLCR